MSNWYIEFLKAYGDIKERGVLSDELIKLFFPPDQPMHQEFIASHGRSAAIGLIEYIVYYLKIRRSSKRALSRIALCLSEELRLIRRGFYETNLVSDLGNYRQRLPIAVKE
jgi:hypothetical protein